MSRCGCGRTWIVTSRLTAALPVGRARRDEFGRAGAEGREEGQDRDRRRQAPGPPAESTGTSGALRRRAAGSGRASEPRLRCGAACARARGIVRSRAHSSICSRPSPSTRRRASSWSIRPRSWVAMTTEVPSRFSSTKRRSSRRRERRVDVAGRLVGEQQLGPRDQRAGDRGALLLAAGEDRRQHVHAVAEADPAQELDHLGAGSSPPPCPGRAAAGRRSRRWSGGRAGGNPGTPRPCGGAGR